MLMQALQDKMKGLSLDKAIKENCKGNYGSEYKNCY